MKPKGVEQTSKNGVRGTLIHGGGYRNAEFSYRVRVGAEVDWLVDVGFRWFLSARCVRENRRHDPHLPQ